MQKRFCVYALFLIACLVSHISFAGAQQEEPLSNSVKALMQKSVSDHAAPKLFFSNEVEAKKWLDTMSERLKKGMPDQNMREEFLRTVHYEATRAGLDPQLVLGLIQIESGFNKYAVSSVRARGFMQVMPFWVSNIGAPDHDLFHLRLNLRYGCRILRHYLDVEHGDLYRALGRYNGSLGQPQYPNAVVGTCRHYWSCTQ